MDQLEKEGPAEMPVHVREAADKLHAALWATVQEHWLANSLEDRLVIAMTAIAMTGGNLIGRVFLGHEEAIQSGIKAMMMDMEAAAVRARDMMLAEMRAMNLVN